MVALKVLLLIVFIVLIGIIILFQIKKLRDRLWSAKNLIAQLSFKCPIENFSGYEHANKIFRMSMLKDDKVLLIFLGNDPYSSNDFNLQVWFKKTALKNKNFITDKKFQVIFGDSHEEFFLKDIK